MAGQTINISPNIIKWVIQKVQFENTNTSILESLYQWLSGEKAPTFSQLENVSKKTNIPFGYFFLTTPPEETCNIVEYRTVDSVEVIEPSRNLIDTLDKMTEIQEWMRGYLIDSGNEELPFVGKFKDAPNELSITNDIRTTLNLAKNWYTQVKSSGESFKYLRSLFENIGILVMLNGIVGQNTHRKLEISEFRAFTLVDNYAPLIFINTCDSENGKIFSLVHELVHIWIGVDNFYNDQFGNATKISEIEKICNSVSAEILVPNEYFLKKWNETNLGIFEKSEVLSKYFNCSKNVIVRRAFDNSYITRDEYDKVTSEFIEQFKQWEIKNKEKKTNGGNYYKTMETRLDKRLMKALESSAKEGKTQYTEVYRLTNTNRSTFSKLLDAGGEKLW